MAYEQRAPLNYLAGTLSSAAAISDTALVSDSFATLPTDYTTTKYLPVVLHDPSTGVYEVVWVTAHASTSTTATVVRAREATTARAWPTASNLICAPTIRDTVSTTTLAGLPTDAHTGMRVDVTDKQYTAERLHSGAWGPSTGVALGDDVGPRRTGANPPSSAGIYVRAGYASLVTNSSSQVTVTYRTAFPTATIAVAVTPTGASVPLYSVPTETATGFTVQAWVVSSLSPFTTVGIGTGYTATFTYLAIGY